MRIGRLRHMILLEQKVTTNTGGVRSSTWTTFAADVPASIEPISAREFISAGAPQGGLASKIVIRYMPGVRGEFRATDQDGNVYDIAAPIPDNKSGQEWLTLVGTTGVNDG